MIDSTGRTAMRADGTVLDLFPVGQVLTFSGVLLVALFTLIKPEASNGLGPLGRVVFWSLHVGLGLTTLWIAGRWLAHGGQLPHSTMAAVLITGCAAILLAAPGYLLLDALFASHTVDLDPDPPINWPLRLVREIVQLSPWFMVTWLIINLPVLLPQAKPTVRMDDSVSRIDKVISDNELSADAREMSNGSGLPNVAFRNLKDHEPLTEKTTQEPPADTTQKQNFLLHLPGVVGTDVVAVSSDLHYLNVWTVAGRTTVLGNLRDVVADLGDMGMQVHRSHWVAHAHVRRIIGTANNASCVLSNELRVPISRRRWKSVREHYGRGIVHTKESDEPQPGKDH